MKIELTPSAQQFVESKTNGKAGYLKLRYETEGTGCVLNGVPALWFVSEPDDGDEKLETNVMPILVETSKKVFYDEQLKIDVTEKGHIQLKAPSHILNGRMAFIDHTKN
ncbi:heme biosynthesis protein HemY [Bacillus coahuilensis m2-6]|uniref:Heme biosynthesis protein HemY n=1 Tax=Bacillus coahuilensis p1.1.43 TaxID=1150625 RepID=A0A147K7Z7_9BACI|nr:iron-sulfur cluster biosynthesis family protein [Bacillus coahuilensis]KUP06283.1 heme biosynthesis protein HemY [Bacillus coahuilensis p1.1.43]KUP07700.1 heme biosynthesis protein HemY [Bacillus coahuilensis m2-6]